MVVYENIFLYKNKLHIREFNTETNEAIFKTQELEMPFFYPQADGNYKAYIPSNLPELRLKRQDLSIVEFNKEKKQAQMTQRTLYGRNDLTLEWIFQNYPEPIKCIHKFHTWFFDIEVSGKIDEGGDKDSWKPENALQEITLIQIFDSKLQKYIILSLKEYTGDLDLSNTTIEVYKDEKELLKGFLRTLSDLKPALIVGWNTIAYDYPYLTHRIARVLDNISDLTQDNLLKGYYVRSLSPFGIVEKHFNENEYLWNGIILEDYLQIYKKYTSQIKTLDSYSLNSVALHELGAEKISHDEYINFTEFYNSNFNKFLEYGVKDIELLFQLDNKLKLLDLCIFISYMCGVCIPDIRGTLKQWNNYVYNEAFKKGIILPLKSHFSKSDVKFIGGLVHSTTNKWNYVASFDFTSLYPSLISWMNLGGDTLYIPKENETDLLEIQKNMLEFSPHEDTKEIKSKIIKWTKNLFNTEKYKEIHDVLEKHNLALAPNGTFFTKSKKSLFAELIENLLVKRQESKREMKKLEKEIEILKANNTDYTEKQQLQDFYNTNQMALKVMANSAYGILSMSGCSFAGSEKYFSNAITTSGQVVDVFCACVVSDIVEKINNSLDEEYKVKDRSKDTLKWISTMDTDSFYVCFEPLINLVLQKQKKLEN